MIQPKTAFEQELYDQFVDGEDVIEVIRKHEFEPILSKAFVTINNLIENNQLQKIPKIVSHFLITINTRLGPIIRRDKVYLEDLISEIFRALKTQIEEKESGAACIFECQESLKIACETEGYDYNALARLLNLAVISDKKIPFYKWTRTQKELKTLLERIAKKEIIQSASQFEELFSPIKNGFTFEMDSTKKRELVVFVSLLKEFGLIEMQKKNGHFVPLDECARDKGKKVYKPPAYKEHYNFKRSKPTNPPMDVLFKCIISSICNI